MSLYLIFDPSRLDIESCAIMDTICVSVLLVEAKEISRKDVHFMILLNLFLFCENMIIYFFDLVVHNEVLFLLLNLPCCL